MLKQGTHITGDAARSATADGRLAHTFDDVSDKRLVCEDFEYVLAMTCVHGHRPISYASAISIAGEE